MPDQNLEAHIREVLTGDEQKNALALAAFLRENEMQFERGSGYWADKRYHMVMCKDEVVCFILINGYGSVRHQDEPEGWIIWSNASDSSNSQWYENAALDENINDIARRNIYYCAKCSPGSSCYGGLSKVIFGQEYENVCRTTFRFDNPNSETVECVKKLLKLKISEKVTAQF